MPLNKSTRSIFFNQGVSDDTDRFLLKSPAVDYIENYRYKKDGSFQKRPGNVALASTGGVYPPLGLQSQLGDPFFLHAIGDDLFTASTEGVYKYSGASQTWTEIQTEAVICKSSPKFTVNPKSGLSAHQSVKIPNETNTWVVCYELIEQVTLDVPNPTMNNFVVLEVYRDDVLAHSLRLTDYTNPSLNLLDQGSSPALVEIAYYNAASDTIEIRQYDWLNNAVSGQTVLESVPHRRTVYDFPLDVIGGAQRDRFDFIGSIRSEQSRIFTSAASAGNPHIVAYSPSRAISQIDRISDFGVRDAQAFVGAGVGAGQTGMAVILDVLASDDGGSFLVLWGEVLYLSAMSEPSEDNFVSTRIILSKYTWSPPGATNNWDTTLETITNVKNACYPISGTITNDLSETIGGDDGWAFAYHLERPLAFSRDLPGEQLNAMRPTKDAGVRFGAIDSLGTEKYPKMLARQHRLTTNMATFRNASGVDQNRFIVGIQQYTDPTPFAARGLLDDINGFSTAPLGRKSVTTVLVETRWDLSRLIPIATLGAGVSGHTDSWEALTNGQLSSLAVESTSTGKVITAFNRQRDTPDDGVIHFDSGGHQTGYIAAVSESRVILHKIETGVSVPVSTFGDGALIHSGVPLWLDTKGLIEASPLDQPEIVRVDGFSRGGQDGEIVGRLYQYHSKIYVSSGATDWRILNVVVGYTDARGNLHRSAASADVYCYRMGRTDGPDSQSDEGRTVLVHATPPLSVMNDVGRTYSLNTYSANGGGGASHVSGQATFEPNNFLYGSGISVQYSETVQINPANDTWRQPVVRASSLLYTSGNVLPSDPWPNLTQTVASSTRLWGIGADSPGTVFYSKLFEEFIAPEFSSVLVMPLGDERTLTAIGKLDDKIVVFERDEIHIIYGQGPDNTGQGQDFAINSITTDVGCEDPDSVVETPVGLMFYHKPRGFYMLTRNLEVKFIGGGVEDLSRALDIVDATLDPSESEVRFLVKEDFDWTPTVPLGPNPHPITIGKIERPPRPIFGNALPNQAALSYNYEKNGWVVYSNYQGEAATLYQKKYTRILSPSWAIWQESRTEWSDPVGTNRTLLRSPPVKFESVQDFQRVWRITFLGRYLSSLRALPYTLNGENIYEAGDIKVSLYYDYEAEPAQVETFHMQDFGYNPFDNVPARAERFQFVMFPNRGRCQAIQIEIEEVNSIDRGEGLLYGLGNGFEIVSADFSLGLSQAGTTKYLQSAVQR